MSEKKELKELSLEESFEELDKILETLEEADVSLEDSFKAYEKGMELVKHCNDSIDLVEKKIKKMNGDGSLEEL